MINESVLIKKGIGRRPRITFAEIVEQYKNYVFAIILNFIKDYNEVRKCGSGSILQVYLSPPTMNLIILKVGLAELHQISL